MFFNRYKCLRFGDFKLSDCLFLKARTSQRDERRKEGSFETERERGRNFRRDIYRTKLEKLRLGENFASGRYGEYSLTQWVWFSLARIFDRYFSLKSLLSLFDTGEGRSRTIGTFIQICFRRLFRTTPFPPHSSPPAGALSIRFPLHLVGASRPLYTYARKKFPSCFWRGLARKVESAEMGGWKKGSTPV